MLGDVDSVASFITVDKQFESNPDCSFHFLLYVYFRDIMSPEFISFMIETSNLLILHNVVKFETNRLSLDRVYIFDRGGHLPGTALFVMAQ